MSNAIVPGSLQAIALAAGSSIAESFINADTVILVDTSASMQERDSRGGQTRYRVACDELARLQRTLPGKIAVIAFSDRAVFCPSGVPENLCQNTGLAKALRFAHVADDCGIAFVVISDGEPDSESEALAEAKRYTSTISTIFTGPEGGAGQAFLARLAAASGGRHLQAHQAQDLADGVQKLLTAGAA